MFQDNIHFYLPRHRCVVCRTHSFYHWRKTYRCSWNKTDIRHSFIDFGYGIHARYLMRRICVLQLLEMYHSFGNLRLYSRVLFVQIHQFQNIPNAWHGCILYMYSNLLGCCAWAFQISRFQSRNCFQFARLVNTQWHSLWRIGFRHETKIYYTHYTQILTFIDVYLQLSWVELSWVLIKQHLLNSSAYHYYE